MKSSGIKIALILTLLAVTSYAGEPTSLREAPDFKLQDIDGNELSLDSVLQKGPVLMSFWVLWCDMCIKELDALRAYTGELESLNVTLLAISQDKTRAIPRVDPFAKSHKWKYEVILDPENMMRDLFDVQELPTLFIIDQNKKIVFTHQGYQPGDEKTIIEMLRGLYAKNQESPEQ